MSLPNASFEYLEHTADIQVHAWGTNLIEAFQQTGYALYDCMTKRFDVAIDPSYTTTISVQATDLPELLYNYLDELLFKFHTTPFLVAKRIEINSLLVDELCLVATLYGEPFDRKKHYAGIEVKAITTSNIRIAPITAPYDIYVILDI